MRIDHALRDPEFDPNAATPPDLVNVHLVIAPTAKPGSYLFRVVTKQGVSNAISMRVTNEHTIEEAENLTAEPGHAPRLEAFPMVVNGRIAKKREVDYYRFDAHSGETLSFEVFSGFSAFEPSGSWFDPQRLNRVTFNDEPFDFPDFSTEAKLVHRFEHGGSYLVSVEHSKERALRTVFTSCGSPQVREPLHLCDPSETRLAGAYVHAARVGGVAETASRARRATPARRGSGDIPRRRRLCQATAGDESARYRRRRNLQGRRDAEDCPSR